MSRKEMLDLAGGLWPTWLTYVVVPLSMYFQLAWVGALVLAVVLCCTRYWWNCLLGLLNWLTVVIGFGLCAVTTLRSFV